MEGDQWCVGSGNYSRVIETSFEDRACVAKVVRRYRDVHSPGRSEQDRHQSDLDEKDDLHTECSLLQQLGNSTLMDWKWVPHMHMVMLHKDMPTDYSERVTEAVGFEPAALLYMEQLEVTFDKYLQSSIEQMPSSPAKRQNHDMRLLLLMCDLLAAIVGMHRMGVRHNDLMLRNVMLRKRPVAAQGRRHLTLSGSQFVWPVHPHYEVVLIDFGLASVSRDSALRETDDTLIVHEDRDRAFGSNRKDAEVLYKHRHPLKCYRKAVGRNLMDLNCLWYSLYACIKRCEAPSTFADWAKRYMCTLRQVNRSADATGRPTCLEQVVREVFPTECCVET